MHDWTLPTSTPGSGDLRAGPEDHDDHQDEQQLAPQVRSPEGVRERGQHEVPLFLFSRCLEPGRERPRQPNPADLARAQAPSQGNGQATVTVPPAASIFSLAEAENAWAVTSTLTESVALAEDLDRLAVADGALGDERVDGDLAAVGEELADPVEVDDLELDLERVLEALELRAAACGSASGHPRRRPGPGSGPWCPWCHGRRSCPWRPHRDPRGSWRSWRPEPGAGGGA